MFRINFYSVIFATTLAFLAPACGSNPGPGEKAAETAEANGPEAWFVRTERNTRWCPPNPNIKIVSVDELLVPCAGGKRAENVVAFGVHVYGWETDFHLGLASVDGRYWADLGVEGSWPEFSPDGTKIVYDGREGLCVINADGSGKTVLCDEGDYWGDFAFTPDSRAVVNIGPKGESAVGIFIADVAGRGRRLIYSSDEYLASPSLPASGKKIAFEKGTDIYVTNVDGSGLRRVTGPSEENEYAGDVDPTFSPDGSKIAFLSDGDLETDHGMSFDVYVVNADGTGRRNLTADDKRDERTYFSRDGERIVFYSWEGGITVADVNTFELRRIPTTYGGGNHYEFLHPCFSPDDRKIAYDPAAGENFSTRQIYVINADGTDDTWISPGGRVNCWGPSFSPMRVDGVLLDTYGRVIEE